MSHLILVVDDEPPIRDCLTELLIDEGYRVSSARDGQEALEMAAREAPDVVVSDVTMPRCDGVELVRRLRARGHDVPVVLISARYAAVDIPGVRFIAKPFDVDELVHVVEHSLEAAAG